MTLKSAKLPDSTENKLEKNTESFWSFQHELQGPSRLCGRTKVIYMNIIQYFIQASVYTKDNENVV